jgi:ubiquinone biosynthesis protein UbiJ
MIGSTTADMLTAAFNRYLALDPEAPEKLRAFDGKLIAIDVRGPNVSIYLAVEGDRVNVVDQHDAEPDATIIGSPAALFKLGVKRDSADLFFKGEVEIRGDTRLGRQFKSVLAEMDIDWEEQLSRLVGDIAAHRLMSAVGDLRQWGRSAASNFSDDVGEYLQEESRDVVGGAELDMFNQQVDEIRDGAERLQVRIDRLAGAKTSE